MTVNAWGFPITGDRVVEALRTNFSTNDMWLLSDLDVPSGAKSGNGDVHPGGQEAADAAWDSIKGVGETKRYEDRHGNVTEVKDLDGGGVADRHTSTKSDHKGAPTIKIRDAESKVVQTTRYEKSQ